MIEIALSVFLISKIESQHDVHRAHRSGTRHAPKERRAECRSETGKLCRVGEVLNLPAHFHAVLPFPAPSK